MNNWSDTMWTNQIKASDPKYAGTSDYKQRTASFDWYWKSIMGEQTPVDPSLAHQYAAGGFTDPSALFDQVKSTAAFAAQYPDWAAFSAGQTAHGRNAVMDPLSYKSYGAGFDKAMADAGLSVDPNFKHNFFSSGLSTVDFANNVDQYVTQGGAYNWQTGQQADLQTAAGVANPTAGGDLRKKLAEALQQHQTYLQSKFQPFQAQDISGNIAQKI
jgi:hypothetical protein